MLQQESFPFNCQGSIKLFNVLISIEWRVGKYKKEFFHFDFRVKFHWLFQLTSVTPDYVCDGLEGEAHFLNGRPKGRPTGSRGCRVSKRFFFLQAFQAGEGKSPHSTPGVWQDCSTLPCPAMLRGLSNRNCGFFSQSDSRSRVFSWCEQHPHRDCLVAISSLACNQATSLWKLLAWKNNIREGSLCC